MMSGVDHIKALVRDLILPHPAGLKRSFSKADPLIIAGMFRTGNGIGRAARCCYEALTEEGLRPLAVDVSGLLNQANIVSSVPLDSFPSTGFGTLILFVNPPEIERSLMGLGLRRWQSWRIIGAWAWETAIAPEAWKRQTAYVSEIWAPSQFCAAAFEAAYNKPVRTVPHFVRPVPNGLTTISLRSNDTLGNDSEPRPLRVLTVADARSSLERKNPAAAVQMFRAAFPDQTDVGLTLKCRELALFPAYAASLVEMIGADPRISIVDRTLSDAEQARLIEDSDIVLSTHRSEGFGLHLAEAMALGKCVIATGWSGNLEFMNESNSVLLAYSQVPVSDETGVYTSSPGSMWADVDIAAGAEVLRRLYESDEQRAAISSNAKASIARILSSRQYLQALLDP